MLEPLFTMSAYEILGLAGVVFYLGSYAALQFDILDAKGIAYSLLNFLAASSVLISLLENFNFPSLLIQVFWIAISLYGIAKLMFLQQPASQPSQ